MKALARRVLWLRASDFVGKYKPLLIGVTGSTGKTLTKEAIALALKDDRRVRASHANYNTPVGVALSVLGVQAAADRRGWIRLLTGSLLREMAEKEPDTIVLELGADRPGDIDALVQKLPFTIGVMTNIGSAHLDYFGSKEMVAHEKMSLLVSLPEDGVAVMNADDPLVLAMQDYVRAKTVFFGEAQHVDVRLARAQRAGTKGFSGEVHVQGTPYEFFLPHIVARHQLTSFLAALAVTHALQVDIRRAIGNLRSLTPPPGRVRLFEGLHHSTIIDDTYNASPESTLAALRTLESLPGRRKIAILGDMLELGPKSFYWHNQVGGKVAEVTHVFVAVGEEMRRAQAKALEAGGVDTHHFQTSRDVGKWLRDHLKEGDVVLIKGSRAMAMEKVVERLLANSERDGDKLVH